MVIDSSFSSVNDVFDISSQYIESNEVIPFGKHKGKLIKDVPQDYLLWLCYESDYFQSNENKNIRLDCKNYLLHNFVMPFGKVKDMTVKAAALHQRSWCMWIADNEEMSCKALQKLINDAIFFF